MTNTGNMRTL